nr:uncharacterized protein LOC113818905 [Penaeus vannamei]
MSERAEEVRTSLTSGSGDVSALTSQMDALQTRHAQLTLEQNELLKAQRKAKSDRVSVCSEDRERGEDSDSQFSYSGASSPSQSYLQQLVQDTLVDEGLRVVKESLNQQKDAVSAVVSRAQDGSYPRPPQQQQGQQAGQQQQPAAAEPAERATDREQRCGRGEAAQLYGRRPERDGVLRQRHARKARVAAHHIRRHVLLPRE